MVDTGELLGVSGQLMVSGEMDGCSILLVGSWLHFVDRLIYSCLVKILDSGSGEVNSAGVEWLVSG